MSESSVPCTKYSTVYIFQKLNIRYNLYIHLKILLSVKQIYECTFIYMYSILEIKRNSCKGYQFVCRRISSLKGNCINKHNFWIEASGYRSRSRKNSRRRGVFNSGELTKKDSAPLHLYTKKGFAPLHFYCTPKMAPLHWLHLKRLRSATLMHQKARLRYTDCTIKSSVPLH